MDVGDRLKNFRWPRLPFIRYIWPSFVKYGLRDFFIFSMLVARNSRAQSRTKMVQAMRIGTRIVWVNTEGFKAHVEDS